MPITQPDPAEQRFATLALWLGKVVAAAIARGLAAPLILVIWRRVSGIARRFARLAARIRSGRYRPRTFTPRPGAGRPAGRPNTLPSSFAWLLPLVPEAAASASQLRYLLTDPEMAALIVAAPASMGRVLRPLCRMLGVELPAILAPPRPPPPPLPAPSGPPAEAPAATAARRQPSPRRCHRPPPVSAPDPVSAAIPARACGPPYPA